MPRPHAPLLSALTLFAIPCLLALCAGCQTRVTHFSVLATQDVDVSHLEHAAAGARPTSGSSGVLTLGAIPLSPGGLLNEATGRSTGNWEIDRAVGQALRRSPGAVALSDVVLKDTVFSVPFLWNYRACTVRGKPLVAATRDTEPPPPEVARLEPAR